MNQPSRLMNRNFFLLWQGQLVSQMGNQINVIATVFFLKKVTNSATLVGLIMMISALPSVVLGIIGGTFADRYSRRTIIVCCDLLNGLALLILAAVVFFYSEFLNVIILGLFVTSAFVAGVDSFFKPAITAAVPDLVPQEQVAKANSLNQASLSIAVFMGQGLGGFLFRFLGAPILFLLNGLTYIFSAASESFIQIPKTNSNSHKQTAQLRQFYQETIAGFRYVWQKKGMKELFLASASLNIFSVPIMVLLPFYVEDTLQVTADWYGFFLAASTIGSMIGYVLAGIIQPSGKQRIIFLIGLILSVSLAYIGLGLVRIPAVALPLMSIIGMSMCITIITVITILQITTPTEMRGRLFGILGTFSNGLSPIAMALSGVFADLTNQNIPLIYITCGSISCLIGISLLLNRELHNLLA